MPDGELVGLTGRAVHEDDVQIFGVDCSIFKQFPEDLLLQATGDPRKFKVRTCAVDIREWWLSATVQKTLNLNLGEKDVSLGDFPDLCSSPDEALSAHGRLSGDHIQLQNWIAQRDLIDKAGATLIAPVVLYQFVAAELKKSEEAVRIRFKAGQVLIQKFKRCGLMCLPVYAAPTPEEARWTLLAFRKVGEDKVDCRYYDSLNVEAVFNRTVADDVLNFMKSTFPKWSWPDVLPPRYKTRSRQTNGIDC